MLGSCAAVPAASPPLRHSLQPGTTGWLPPNGTTGWLSSDASPWPSRAANSSSLARGWGHARDVESLRLSMPLPANMSRLRQRWRVSAAERPYAPRRSRLVRHGPTRKQRSPPLSAAGGGVISLHGATSMPSERLLFAEEINCVYTKQNCTCDFNCPCEINGLEGREALWCGCEQIFNCTCEMRSGACVVGPADDAYLFFPGLVTGTGGYLAALRGGALDFSGKQSFTLEAWVRPYKFSANTDQTIISRWNNQVGGQWILYLDMAKRLCFQRATRTVSRTNGVATGTTEQAQPLCSSMQLPRGEWTHVAALYDGAALKRRLVVNGSADRGDQQEDLAQVDGETALVIGGHLDQHMPAGLFHGEIDDVRVWAVARTATEVAAYSTYRLTGYLPPLKAYWRMDEGRGSTVPDMSGWGHEAEMRGALEWRYMPKLFGGDKDRHTGYIRSGYGTPGTASWHGMAQEVPLGLVPRDDAQASPYGPAPRSGFDSLIVAVPKSNTHWEDV